MTNVRALQSVELAKFWEEFAAVMGGPEGLMTYRYLGTHAEAQDRHHATGNLRLRSDLRSSHGLLAAPLTILVADVIGILDDAIAVPAPTQIALEILDNGAGVEEVFCEGEMFHEGRAQLFSRARLYDAADHGRMLALCRDAGAVLAAAPEGYHYVDPGPGVPDSLSLPPLWQAFDARRRPDGRLEVPELTGRIGSTSGSLHHGPTQIVLETAARGSGRAGRRGRCVPHLPLARHLLRAGTHGPFVADPTVLIVRDDAIAVEVDFRDEGNDRLIAAASAVFRRL